MATPSPFQKIREGAQSLKAQIRAFQGEVEQRRRVPSTSKPGTTQARIQPAQTTPQRDRIESLIRSIRGQ